MQIVDKKISIEELNKMSEKMFDSLVKAVVDIEKEIMGNRSRGIENAQIQEKIKKIVNK